MFILDFFNTEICYFIITNLFREPRNYVQYSNDQNQIAPSPHPPFRSAIGIKCNFLTLKSSSHLLSLLNSANDECS